MQGYRMNKKKYMLLLLTLITSILSAHNRIQKTFEKISSLIKKEPLEKIDQRELSAVGIKQISIHNIHGPISIKTGWEKETICLKTIKKAKKQENLNNLTVTINTTQPHHLVVSSHDLNKKRNDIIEYELIIPLNLAVQLKTKKGNIIINKINGPIKAMTDAGTITISNTKNTICAQTNKTGDIIIEKAQGSIQALSRHGNITINNPCNNITAHSTRGKLMVTCDTISPSSIFKLETITGNITLRTPTKTDAYITAKTTHGTVTSDHPITLKPYTTKLNSTAWNLFKKEIEGTLGSGGAQIAFKSTHGNVKIVETHTT